MARTGYNRGMVEYNEFQLNATDGTRLLARRSLVDTPVATVFVVHGLGEHGGRYDHVTEHLNSAGMSVYLIDHRGHGRSTGTRGHVDHFDQYSEDLELLFKTASDDGQDNVPWFVVGHSMGGLIAVHLALRNQEKLAGLVLSGPLLGIAVDVPAIKAAVGRLLSRVLPRLTLANELDARYISHDPAVVAAYENDPLVHDRVSARWFTEMSAALDKAHERARDLELPLLLMHGTDDHLTDPQGSRRFVSAYGGTADSEFLDGYYHEIFNEVEQQVPLSRMTKWLNDHLS